MWWQWWWLCFTIDKSGNLEKECHQNKRLRSSKRSWIVADWNGGSHEEEETNENICCKCFVKCSDVFPTQVNQGRWIITGVRLQSRTSSIPSQGLAFLMWQMMMRMMLVMKLMMMMILIIMIMMLMTQVVGSPHIPQKAGAALNMVMVTILSSASWGGGVYWGSALFRLRDST